MDEEQRGSLYLGMTLSRTLTLSLSLPITKMSLITNFSNTSQGFLKVQEREGVHKTLQEMEKQQKISTAKSLQRPGMDPQCLEGEQRDGGHWL